MLVKTKSPKHAYHIVTSGVLEILQQQAKQKSKNFVPSYNLIKPEITGLDLNSWDGKAFSEVHYELQPLSTYDSFSLVFGARKYNQSFIYLGESRVYQSENEKKEAQRVRNDLELQMKKTGKYVKHREIGERSSLHGFPDHSSYIMCGFPEAIALSEWYANDCHQNVYITPSAWCCPLHYDNQGKQRQKRDLASFQSLVVDIDCDFLHADPSLSQNKFFLDLLSNKVKKLMTILFDGNYAGLPLPLLVHDTCRGLQLWYVFGEVSAKAESLYQRLVDAVSTAYSNAFAEYYEHLCIDIWLNDAVYYKPAFSFDAAVMRRQITGWARSFNTFNASTGQRTQAYSVCKKGEVCKRPSIHELIKQFEEVVSDQQINNEITYNHVKNEQSSTTGSQNVSKNCFYRRMSAVQWLIGHRQGKGDCAGWRDVLLFQYYNAAVVVMSRDTAWDKTCKLNEALTYPLSDGEMHDIKYAVDHVADGRYKYKEVTWLAALSLTDDEQDHVQSILSASREKVREEKKEKKQLRDAQIEALASATKVKKIAKQVGVSEKTVRRRLKASGIDQKDMRDTQVINLYQAGKTQKEIADALGISTKTVRRVLQAREVLQ